MIWFLKLAIFAHVLVDWQKPNVDAGYITWKVKEEPLVFGGDVGIQCTYHNSLSCTAHIFWTWITEPKNELIMTNGIPSEKYKNGKKYSEIRSSCTQYSNLVISNFSEIDYSKRYKCGIANINSTKNSFVEYPKEEITFENISYEYTPAQKMVSTVLSLKNQQVSLILKIDKIYPVPECQAIFADTDVTNALKVQKKKTGLFYNVAFTYTTSDMSMASFGDLCISCNGTRRQWKSVNPFCKKKSDLTTESNLVDISPVEDLTTERNLVVSTKEDLTTERNLVDISQFKGFYLAAIVFVGAFNILYPVSVVVVIIRLYYASKDQFDKIKHILSGIDIISYVCIGSSFMFGFLSYGGLDIKAGPELPILVERGLNVFSIIVMLCPCICCIPISSVKVFAERKLPEKTWCLKFGTVLFQIFFFSFIMYLVCDTKKLSSTMVLNRKYRNVFFFWMPILEPLLLYLFLFSKFTCMKSMEELHKTKDGRLHRKTGNSESVDTVSNSQHDEEIRESSESVYNTSSSQNDEEMKECFLPASNRQSDEKMSTYV